MPGLLKKCSWMVRGCFVHLDSEDGVYRATVGDRTWYIPFPKRWMALWALEFMEAHHRYQQYLQPEDTIIEVGACTGEYAVPAALRVEKGHLWAFEPDPVSFLCLKKNVHSAGLTDRITLVNRAISDKDGETLSFTAPDNTVAGGALSTEDGQMQMETVTLDTYLEQNPIRERIGLLKITVNGFEPEVILGAAQTLERVDSLSFQSERHEETEQLASRHGFEVVESDDLGNGVRCVFMAREPEQLASQ